MRLILASLPTFSVHAPKIEMELRQKHLFLPRYKPTRKIPQSHGAKVVGDFAPPFAEADTIQTSG
jgi:hypothetical protein